MLRLRAAGPEVATLGTEIVRHLQRPSATEPPPGIGHPGGSLPSPSRYPALLSGLFHGFRTRCALAPYASGDGKRDGSTLSGGVLRKPDDSPWRPETPGAVVCASTGDRPSRQFPQKMGQDRHGLAPGRPRRVRPGVRCGRSPYHVPVQVHRLATDAGHRPLVLQDRRPQRPRRGRTVHSSNGDNPGRRSGASQELLEPRAARVERTGRETPQVRVGRVQARGVADV